MLLQFNGIGSWAMINFGKGIDPKLRFEGDEAVDFV